MSAPPLGYWDYIRAAFRHRPRLPLVGPLPLNLMGLMGFAVAGLLNPGFWLLGLALEVGYVGLLASHPRFQRLVQGLQLLDRQRTWESRLGAQLRGLPEPAQLRYRQLLGECGAILGVDAPSPARSATDSLGDLRAGNLNQLLALFLRLLLTREAIRTSVAGVEVAGLQADVERLRQRLAGEAPDTPLVRSLQATLDIQQKRLDNLERAAESLSVIDAELERIERQVRLIREESAMIGGPEMLSARLDAVTGTLNETFRWMDQHADLLGPLSDDLLTQPPPALPQVPLPDPPTRPTAGRTRQRLKT